jgi:hypothetical protein
MGKETTVNHSLSVPTEENKARISPDLISTD